MSNEIKVKVSYDKADCSKITSLLHELDKTKEVTEQTVTHNTPLIEASGEALYSAICEQLEPITSAMYELTKRRKQDVHIGAQYEDTNGYQYFTVKVNRDGEAFVKYHNEYKFSLSNYGWHFDDFVSVKRNCIDKINSNLLLNWNQHRIIDKLIKCLEQQIQNDIDEQSKKTALSNAILKQFGGE